jgi:hypothetical protein
MLSGGRIRFSPDSSPSSTGCASGPHVNVNDARRDTPHPRGKRRRCVEDDLGRCVEDDLDLFGNTGRCVEDDLDLSVIPGKRRRTMYVSLGSSELSFSVSPIELPRPDPRGISFPQQVAHPVDAMEMYHMTEQLETTRVEEEQTITSYLECPSPELRLTRDTIPEIELHLNLDCLHGSGGIHCIGFPADKDLSTGQMITTQSWEILRRRLECLFDRPDTRSISSIICGKIKSCLMRKANRELLLELVDYNASWDKDSRLHNGTLTVV